MITQVEQVDLSIFYILLLMLLSLDLFKVIWENGDEIGLLPKVTHELLIKNSNFSNFHCFKWFKVCKVGHKGDISDKCIVYVWSPYDVGNIEQRTPG